MSPNQINSNFISIDETCVILDYIRSHKYTNQREKVTKGGIYVTTMGLNYLVYEETKRSNVARESENTRSNTARESENFRSATASLVETVQHNRNTENLGWGQLSEQGRSNRARETENTRTNVANEGIGSRNLDERQYQFSIENLSDPTQAYYSREKLGTPSDVGTLDAIYTGIDYVKGFIPLTKGKR